MPSWIHYTPHRAQNQIHHARGKRFRTICTGRRFGKTLCLAAELADRGSHEGGGDFGWVAPTYNVAERGIEAFRTIGEGVVRMIGRAPCRVEFEGLDNGPTSRVWFLSADNPDNIRGYGFRGLVIDEAASIPQDVWHYVLRPTIAQTLGWAVFISTPKGRNWFYDMFTRGLDPTEKDYASFRFPSNMSPFFPEKEWDEARRTLPEDVFRQEYMAEFLEDSAGVFRNIDGCLIPEIEPRIGTDGHGWQTGRTVVIGCDVAKHTDWTVLIAMDAETGRCFAMERFNQLDWPIQKERIVAFARRYRGRVILDATGVGDPIYDDLKRVIPDIEGFRLTTGSKTELIQRLIVAVEQARVRWPAGRNQGSGFGVQAGGGAWGEEQRSGVHRATPVTRDTGPSAVLSQAGAYTYTAPPAPPCGRTGLTRSGAGAQEAPNPMPAAATPIAQRDGAAWGGGAQWDILTNEMKRYEYQIMPSGGISYGAPAGFHDDCVMALALANHRRWETENCGHMLRVGGGERRAYAMARRRERCMYG